jgi:hypothetical protein
VKITPCRVENYTCPRLRAIQLVPTVRRPLSGGSLTGESSPVPVAGRLLAAPSRFPDRASRRLPGGSLAVPVPSLTRCPLCRFRAALRASWRLCGAVPRPPLSAPRPLPDRASLRLPLGTLLYITVHHPYITSLDSFPPVATMLLTGRFFVTGNEDRG